ncbi:ATP-binding response regulator [Planktothrix mougeotii]|uniref:histidine kinase n=1 Tax=Planktothrix mougeotii LEGE 06226 TaxID=1828728 RepID=A0ABR9UIC8_9CYAN|nr:hybrid sensor histidine kinase/response regulator [Planktothrix mougeotii]MBE9146214.1 hybrid sensor histidine kinase/response regulator [Planktothrix mougeotii LEGE 06226]
MKSNSATPSLANILIVDDVPDNLRVLSQVLLQQGYRVRKATNGQFALNSAQLMPPDLILLDVMMPELDGYEACRFLKADERTRDIPIIFITARDDIESKLMGFEVGGLDYITKPFDVQEVVVRVATQLKVSRLQKELQLQKDQLEQKNLQLEQEICDRITAQTELQTLNQELETKVEQRTQELRLRNQELISLQKQLEISLRKEQSLSEMKSQLITTISHEFRTPLTVIMTSNELIKYKIEKQQTQNLDRHLNRVNESVKRIEQILNSAIVLAQAESNVINFEAQILNLDLFTKQILEDWKPLENQSHPIELSIKGNHPEVFKADPNFLKQILIHLLTNAIRYSPEGGTINLELIYQPTEVIFKIRDPGIGIPESELDQVFDAFYRGSNADSISGTPGAGLGLTVVKRLVELHQGTITLESILNQGTIVTLSFPVSEVES